jgi:hypothetical protein
MQPPGGVDDDDDAPPPRIAASWLVAGQLVAREFGEEKGGLTNRTTYLHAEVAARNHDRVGLLEDPVEVLHALLVLHLREYGRECGRVCGRECGRECGRVWEDPDEVLHALLVLHL